MTPASSAPMRASITSARVHATLPWVVASDIQPVVNRVCVDLPRETSSSLAAPAPAVVDPSDRCDCPHLKAVVVRSDLLRFPRL